MGDRYNQRWVNLLRPNGEAAWAITLGQTAYYTCPESDVSAAWHRHEDCHKKQWRVEGRLCFAAKYLWYLLTKGYQDNPYEVAARKCEAAS